jgi:hypothetical protein
MLRLLSMSIIFMYKVCLDFNLQVINLLQITYSDTCLTSDA